jgi:hypothetical protein
VYVQQTVFTSGKKVIFYFGKKNYYCEDISLWNETITDKLPRMKKMKIRIAFFLSVFMMATAISAQNEQRPGEKASSEPEKLQRIAQAAKAVRIMDTTLKTGPVTESKELHA